MKIGVVILSRYNSNRLYGKALKNIKGTPVLGYIIERVSKVFSLDDIVLATSDEYTDNPIVDYAKRKNINYFRGSLYNVSERFYNVAKTYEFDYVIRINGDNIFVDIDLLGELTELAKTGQYDFISNVKKRTYPKGMSIEVVRTSHYANLLPEINKSENYKEHVTLYLYEHELEGKYFYKYNEEIKGIQGIQLALDTQEDFDRTIRIINEFEKPHYEYNLKDLYNILKKLNYV